MQPNRATRRRLKAAERLGIDPGYAQHILTGESRYAGAGFGEKVTGHRKALHITGRILTKNKKSGD
jgi:hypothetical protein